MVTVFVDAENVRRSRWPNVSASRLVERCQAWAAAGGVVAIVVFDGPAPGVGVGEVTVDEHCVLVGTGHESADTWIARAVEGSGAYWLVTSDRELRRRAGGRAEQTIGGGGFLRLLDPFLQSRD